MMKKSREHIITFIAGCLIGGVSIGIAVGILSHYSNHFKTLREQEAREVKVINRVVKSLDLTHVEIDTISASGYRTIVKLNGANENQVEQFNNLLVEELGKEYLYRIDVQHVSAE